MNRGLQFCTMRIGGAPVGRLRHLVVFGTVDCKPVNRNFSEFLSKGRLYLSVHDPPNTRNCTNHRNHNQHSEEFSSRRWPWAYFLNGPNAAASTAPTLIRHWSRGSMSDPEFDPVWVLTTPCLAALFVANDSLMWPAQFGRKLVLGTSRKWLRPRLCLTRPRRWQFFSRRDFSTSRDRLETETTTLPATIKKLEFAHPYLLPCFATHCHKNPKLANSIHVLNQNAKQCKMSLPVWCQRLHAKITSVQFIAYVRKYYPHMPIDKVWLLFVFWFLWLQIFSRG